VAPPVVAAAAAGGAFFVRAGGTLTLNNSTLAGAYSVTGGAAGSGGGATAGQAQGTTLYLQGGTSATVLNVGSGTQTLAGPDALAGAGGLTKSGAGTLALTGANANYTGATTVTGGLINFAAANNFGSGNITLNGGGLQWATGTTTDISSRLAPLGAAGGTFDTNGNVVTLASALSGTGGLTKTGLGTLTVSASTYAGATNVNAGTLRAGAASAFASTSAFTVAPGAVLDLASFNQTIGSLAGAGNVTLGAATLTTGNDNTSTTFSGTISGTGGLTKIGIGTLTLSSVNGYGGGTTVTGGLINFNSANNFGSGLITLNGGGLQWASGTTTDISSQLAAFGSGGATFDTNGNNVTLASTLSGSGGLTKIGAGTLTLSGNNLYSGGTALNAGTLAVGSNGALGTGALTFASGTTLQAAANGLSLANAMTLNGTDTVDTQTNALTLSGLLSGTGGLTKIGSGTLTLSGNNLYSGGTALNAGTLAVGSSTALGTGDLTFASGTTLQAAANGLSLANAMTLNGTGTVDTQANALTLAGNIVGTGGLTKIGAGTLTLSGPSTYTGATNVNAGTLQAGVANAFSPLSAFTVASGATLDFNNFDQAVGSLAGAGSVTLGAATLFTGGDNTSTTFSGTISGSGGLIKIGPGTLTLTGTSTYAGGTMIAGGLVNFNSASNFGTGPILLNGGGLQWAAGTSTDISSRLFPFGADGATFDTNGNTVTLASALSGIGGVTKIGAGTLVLSGTDTYRGPTTVAAGTLTVNGSIANSAVTVNSGATLSGTGTVGATTIASGGTFAPGNSPGTMTVVGNLAFQSGALYLVQVNSTTASSTNASGSAALAGTVQAAFAAGSYATRAYTILSAAGGLGGTTFNTLTTSNLPAGFTASLSYTATDAILSLTATLGQLVVPSAPGQPSAPSGPSALACIFSLNQCNVANALNAFFNNGGALPPAFVTIFRLTGANLGNALSQLSGEAATGAQQGAFQLTNQFLGIMLDPFVDGRSGVGGGGAIGFAPARAELPEDIALAYAKILKEPPKPVAFEQRWSVWGAGYGGSNRTSGDPAVVGSHDLSATTAGGAAGLDYRLAPGTVVGFALAGAGTNWGLAQGLGGGKSDAFQAGLYGTTRWGPTYVAAALAFTNHWMSTDRFAFAADHLSASFNAQSFGGRVESGYRFATIYGGLTPYAAIQAQNFRTPSYTETDLTSGGFALGFNSRNATDTRSELGGRFDRLLLLNPEAALTLRTRVAWAHDWISDPSLAAVFQTLPGASFVVNGATPAKNSALTSAGAELRLANGVVLLAKFDGEFASRASTYAGTGTVRYTW
jgi:autotransporter-associated beta strand protein